MWKRKQNENIMSNEEKQERRIQNLESFMKTNAALNKKIVDAYQELVRTQSDQKDKIEKLTYLLKDTQKNKVVHKNKRDRKKKQSVKIQDNNTTTNVDNIPLEVKNWSEGKEIPKGYTVVHRGKKPFLRKLQSCHRNYQEQFRLDKNRVKYLSTQKHIKPQKVCYDDFSKTIIDLLCKNQYEEAQNFAKNIILTPLTKSKDLTDSNNIRLIRNKASRLPKEKEKALLNILQFIKKHRMTYENGNYCIVFWSETQVMHTKDIDDEIGFAHCSSSYLPFNFTEEQAKFLLEHCLREFTLLLN